MSGPRVWAFGGGKGGVGKSLVCASVGTELARRGLEVVAIDLDLGAANLHTLLGLVHPERTLDDFLSGRTQQLGDARVATEVDNLTIVSGAAAILDAAHPRPADKLRLFDAALALDADIVLLDLGAGTHYTTLDFFNLAGRGLVVTGPEPTSIQNAYAFLKAGLFRAVERGLPAEGWIAEVLDRAAQPRGRGRIDTVERMVEALREIDAEVGETAAELVADHRAQLVINQAGEREERRVLGALGVVTRRYLGIDLRHVGTLPDDPSARRAIRRMKPVLSLAADGPLAQATRALVEDLLADRRGPRPWMLGPVSAVSAAGEPESSSQSAADEPTPPSADTAPPLASSPDAQAGPDPSPAAGPVDVGVDSGREPTEAQGGTHADAEPHAAGPADDFAAEGAPPLAQDRAARTSADPTALHSNAAPSGAAGPAEDAVADAAASADAEAATPSLATGSVEDAAASADAEGVAPSLAAGPVVDAAAEGATPSLAAGPAEDAAAKGAAPSPAAGPVEDAAAEGAAPSLAASPVEDADAEGAAPSPAAGPVEDADAAAEGAAPSLAAGPVEDADAEGAAPSLAASPVEDQDAASADAEGAAPSLAASPVEDAAAEGAAPSLAASPVEDQDAASAAAEGAAPSLAASPVEDAAASAAAEGAAPSLAAGPVEDAAASAAAEGAAPSLAAGPVENADAEGAAPSLAAGPVEDAAAEGAAPSLAASPVEDAAASAAAEGAAPSLAAGPVEDADAEGAAPSLAAGPVEDADAEGAVPSGAAGAVEDAAASADAEGAAPSLSAGPVEDQDAASADIAAPTLAAGSIEDAAARGDELFAEAVDAADAAASLAAGPVEDAAGDRPQQHDGAASRAHESGAGGATPSVPAGRVEDAAARGDELFAEAVDAADAAASLAAGPVEDSATDRHERPEDAVLADDFGAAPSLAAGSSADADASGAQGAASSLAAGPIEDTVGVRHGQSDVAGSHADDFGDAGAKQSLAAGSIEHADVGGAAGADATGAAPSLAAGPVEGADARGAARAVAADGATSMSAGPSEEAAEGEPERLDAAPSQAVGFGGAGAAPPLAAGLIEDAIVSGEPFAEAVVAGAAPSPNEQSVEAAPGGSEAWFDGAPEGEAGAADDALDVISSDSGGPSLAGEPTEGSMAGVLGDAPRADAVHFDVGATSGGGAAEAARADAPGGGSVGTGSPLESSEGSPSSTPIGAVLPAPEGDALDDSVWPAEDSMFSDDASNGEAAVAPNGVDGGARERARDAGPIAGPRSLSDALEVAVSSMDQGADDDVEALVGFAGELFGDGDALDDGDDTPLPERDVGEGLVDSTGPEVHRTKPDEPGRDHSGSEGEGQGPVLAPDLGWAEPPALEERDDPFAEEPNVDAARAPDRRLSADPGGHGLAGVDDLDHGIGPRSVERETGSANVHAARVHRDAGQVERGGGARSDSSPGGREVAQRGDLPPTDPPAAARPADSFEAVFDTAFDETFSMPPATRGEDARSMADGASLASALSPAAPSAGGDPVGMEFDRPASGGGGSKAPVDSTGTHTSSDAAAFGAVTPPAPTLDSTRRGAAASGRRAGAAPASHGDVSPPRSPRGGPELPVLPGLTEGLMAAMDRDAHDRPAPEHGQPSALDYDPWADTELASQWSRNDASVSAVGRDSFFSTTPAPSRRSAGDPIEDPPGHEVIGLHEEVQSGGAAFLVQTADLAPLHAVVRTVVYRGDHPIGRHDQDYEDLLGPDGAALDPRRVPARVEAIHHEVVQMLRQSGPGALGWLDG